MNNLLRIGILIALAGGTVLAAGYAYTSRCHKSVMALPHLSDPNLSGTPLLHEHQTALAPLRASSQLYLEATPAEVFEYLTSETTLPKWMPGLLSARYDHSDSAIANTLGKGSDRTMMFGTQAEYEKIVQFERPNNVAYQILEGVPVQNHLAVMTIETDEEGGTIFSWNQYFNIKRSSLYGWLMPFMVRSFSRDARENLIRQFGGETVTVCRRALF